MKCHEFETAIGADPASQDEQVLAHAAECEACASYRRQMQDMDRLIFRALNVPAEQAAAISPAEQPRRRPAFARWQIAASLTAAVMIGASMWAASTHESFAEQIVTHADHESFALIRSDERVDAQTLAEILGRSNLSLRADAAEVSYASSCPFRGNVVPHLVVQTEQGPVAVMILANEKPVKKMRRFSEDGYEGVIVPAPRGVLAVLGKDVPVEEAAEKLLGAVVYGEG